MTDLLTYYRECERQELDVMPGSTLGAGCCPQCGRPDCRGGEECAAWRAADWDSWAEERAEIEAEMREEARCG